MANTMILTRGKWKFAAALCAASCCELVSAQVAPQVILRVEVVNAVRYLDDTADVTKLATNAGVTAAVPIRNFQEAVYIGDIVAINGQPAKGTVMQHNRYVTLRPTPTPGQAIADVTRDAIVEWIFDILDGGGDSVGSIMVLGAGGGAATPGAPLESTQGNNAIVGGTGSFLGARGYVGANTSLSAAARMASMTEDPSNRITNGAGGKALFVLQVIPMSWPQIMTSSGGPAIVHSSDFSLVSSSKPAAAGEILAMFASGLGPTRPGVDPGTPFPTSPLAAANSPVQVTVNGKVAQVTAAVGFPGAVDGYQVNFQVPPDTAKGAATIQLASSWIAGGSVSIPIQ
jgi:hypothetical protein